QATADKGLNFSVNGGTADNVKLGETVNFANGTNTTAVYDPATNTYKYNRPLAKVVIASSSDLPVQRLS
ncbi:hypothetical protein JH840_003728, partial [Acinetobacter baumannii]|nr:hypothetical protein [Acinetobacter baumannii]